MKGIKIHYDRKIYLLFFLLFVAGMGFLISSYTKKSDCSNVNFEVIALSQTTADLIEFKSTGDDEFKWEWDFGDGSKKEYASNVLHKFDSVGLYNITLKVNNSCVINKQVYIRESVFIEQIDDAKIPTIEFPNKISAGEEVSFTCTSTFATKWEWRFGETDVVQSTEKQARHTFDEAGEYKISLVVNNSLKYVLIKTIVVRSKKEKKRKKKRTDYINEVLTTKIPDNPPVEDIEEENEEENKIELNTNDAKKIFKNYASGKINYKDIRHYFCSENIRVVNAKGRVSNVKTLLKTIRGRQIRIQDISLNKNEVTGCITRINIDLKHRKTKRWFWKRY